MLYRIACGLKNDATCIYLQIFKSVWADLKCWWHCVFFFPLICLSHHEFVSVGSKKLLTVSVCHTHTHTLRCSPRWVKLMTVGCWLVFLDLRRVTPHRWRERERERGKWPVFSEELLSSYHRGRGRDGPIRDERLPDPQTVREKEKAREDPKACEWKD